MPELSATQRVENAVNTYSRPSDLKITDLRVAVVAANYDYPHHPHRHEPGRLRPR
jgi:hypothetical protein